MAERPGEADRGREVTTRRELRLPYLPRLRFGAQDALDHCRESKGSVHVLRDGRVEVWGGESGTEALGWMTRRSLEIYLKKGGKIA